MHAARYIVIILLLFAHSGFAMMKKFVKPVDVRCMLHPRPTLHTRSLFFPIFIPTNSQPKEPKTIYQLKREFVTDDIYSFEQISRKDARTLLAFNQFLKNHYDGNRSIEANTAHRFAKQVEEEEVESRDFRAKWGHRLLTRSAVSIFAASAMDASYPGIITQAILATVFFPGVCVGGVGALMIFASGFPSMRVQAARNVINQRKLPRCYQALQIIAEEENTIDNVNQKYEHQEQR